MEGTMKGYLRASKRNFCLFAIIMVILGLVPVPVLSKIGIVYAQDEVTLPETPEPTAENLSLEEILGEEVTAEPTLDEPLPEDGPVEENQPLANLVCFSWIQAP
jgi:hypothetical protein